MLNVEVIDFQNMLNVLQVFGNIDQVVLESVQVRLVVLFILVGVVGVIGLGVMIMIDDLGFGVVFEVMIDVINELCVVGVEVIQINDVYWLVWVGVDIWVVGVFGLLIVDIKVLFLLYLILVIGDFLMLVVVMNIFGGVQDGVKCVGGWMVVQQVDCVDVIVLW